MKKFLILIFILCFVDNVTAQSNFVKRMAKNAKKEAKIELAKAKAGDMKAQAKVSWYYLNGYSGFPKDDVQMIYWLKKSAESGNASAQYDLGSYYQYGEHGLSKDVNEYLNWCTKAAQNGYEPAYYSLGLYYKDIDKDKAIFWLKKCADEHYAKTGENHEYSLKALKELGVNSASKLTETGEKCMDKAIAGDADAQNTISSYYKYGKEGFSIDEKEMIYWLVKSAENGNPQAQYDLGEYYYKGEYGLTKDVNEYLNWCTKAAKNGYEPAYFSLGLYYEETNKDKAIFCYKKCTYLFYKKNGKEYDLAAQHLKKLGISYNPATQPAPSEGKSSNGSSISNTNNNLANNTSTSKTTYISTSSSSSASSSQAGQNSWRVNRPDGGYENWTRNADGSCFVVTVTPCVWCHGTKVCSVCNGQGGTMGRAYGGMWYACRSCAGTKICQNCHGKGTTTMTTQVAADGTAMGYDQNGRVATNGGSDSNGSSNSSSGKSSKTDKDAWYNKGVDVKEYAPNYTGSEEQYWCEKCKAWDYRHSHITKK